jgi:hypothetical protein
MPRNKLVVVIDGRENTRETNRPYTHVLVGPKIHWGDDLYRSHDRAQYAGYRVVYSWHLTFAAADRARREHMSPDNGWGRLHSRLASKFGIPFTVEEVALQHP